MESAATPESISWLWWPLFTLINIPLLTPIFRWLFGGLGGLWEAIRYQLTPDLISMVRGEFHADWEAGFRLLIFVGVTVALFMAERSMVLRLF